MKMHRAVITALWVASLAVAYDLGGGGKPPQIPSALSPAVANLPTLPAAREPSVELSSEAAPAEPPAAKPDIPALIARTRLAFGGDMRGILNMRDLVRGIEPLLDLDDSQFHEALAGVDRTMHEPDQKFTTRSFRTGRRKTRAPPASG